MPRSTIQGDRMFLQQSQITMSVMKSHHKQNMAAIKAEMPYLMPAEYARRLERARQTHQQEIKELRASCEAARARIQQAIDIATGADGREQNVAREMLSQAAWARMERVLDRQQNLPEVAARVQKFIERAQRTGDVATLAALRTELPLWFEDHMPEASNTADSFLRDVRTALMPWVSAEERTGYQLEADLERYAPVIEGNLNRLEAATTEGGEMWADIGLLGWNGGYIRPGDTAETPNEQQSIFNQG